MHELSLLNFFLTDILKNGHVFEYIYDQLFMLLLIGIIFDIWPTHIATENQTISDFTLLMSPLHSNP
jgi:hypothetical protein